MKGLGRQKKLVFALLVALFTLFVFTPAAYAKGSGSGTSNSPPVITTNEPGAVTVNEDSSGTISLKATDANRDKMTWSITKPSNGTAITSNLTNSRGTSTILVTYTPLTGVSGSDSFTAMASDGKGGTDSITINVTITPKQPPTNISYVALGDSIATGTVYSSNVITSYVTYFYQYLQSKNPSATVILSKLATDGDRTNELYSKLALGGSSGDSELIAAVKGANIITLSIGGNNLMQAAKDSSSLGGYNFNVINTTVAEQGLRDFQAQWIPIIQEIKRLNSDVELIVNTTYNPYNETDASLHNTVDSYLFRNGTGLNDLILTNAASEGYYVANVYQNFNDNYKNDMGEVTYFYPTDFWGTLTRNPHPNSTGQNIIATLCEGVYKPFN